MIYFDRKTLFMLWRIKRSGDKGVTWGALRKRYGEDRANPELLIALSDELYTVTKNHHGDWINFSTWDKNIFDGFRSFSTPKGNHTVEQFLFDFWKWVIPTVISVAALTVSVLTA